MANKEFYSRQIKKPLKFFIEKTSARIGFLNFKKNKAKIQAQETNGG